MTDLRKYKGKVKPYNEANREKKKKKKQRKKNRHGETMPETERG